MDINLNPQSDLIKWTLHFKDGAHVYLEMEEKEDEKLCHLLLKDTAITNASMSTIKSNDGTMFFNTQDIKCAVRHD